MTLGKRILVLACLFVVLPIALTDDCPSREDVAPCTCVDEHLSDSGVMVEIKCSGISSEDLARVASSLRERKVHSFTITHSKLDFIPHDVFKGIKLKMLEIENSSLDALTDNGAAFVGMQHHLEELNIRHCTFKNEWAWSVLKNLWSLKRLTITSSLRLETLGTDAVEFPDSKSLRLFDFTGNNVSVVSDHAFASFEDATELLLSDNKIKNVKRTMFPNPAKALMEFDLSNNWIEQFPEDMFTNMPNLHSLNIAFNKILVLNEKTFTPVWEKLHSFLVLGNPLHCDCSMSWLPKRRLPYYFTGECASPLELEGTKLKQLTSRHLRC